MSTTVGAGPNRGAVSSLSKYLTLKQNLSDHWGLGADILAKYDVEPFLRQFEEFGNLLRDFELLRKRYNEVSEQLRTEKLRGGRRVPKLEQEWLEIGAAISTKAESELRDAGGPLAANVNGFNRTLKQLISKLRGVQTVTPQQRTDLLALLQFLKEQQALASQLANKDFEFIEGMVQKVKERAPIL